MARSHWGQPALCVRPAEIGRTPAVLGGSRMEGVSVWPSLASCHGFGVGKTVNSFQFFASARLPLLLSCGVPRMALPTRGWLVFKT